MGRALRMYETDAVYFVTARTMQARMLLRPSTDTNELVGGVLARAVRRYQAQLYGYVVTSNHLHLLVQVRDGALSRFMQYVLGNIARKVGKLVRWSDAFWERRFSCEHVLDDSAMVKRLKYVLAHGVKEGLVRRVEEWPGLTCLPQLLGGAVRSFKWFHWAKRWMKGKLRRDARGLLDDAYAEVEELSLAILPCWKELTPEQRRERALALVAEIEEAGSETERRPKKNAVAAICRQHPHTRPAKRKKSPRPHSLCHATVGSAREEFKKKYATFVAAFRTASERFRKGELLAAFPPLAFRPPILHNFDAMLAKYKASGT